MVNTIPLKRNLSNAENEYTTMNERLKALNSYLKNNNQKRQISDDWWDKLKSSNGRYIDPYNKTDRTSERQNVTKQFDAESKRLTNEIRDLTREISSKQAQIRSLKLQIVRARTANAQERKDKISEIKQNLKKFSQKSLDAFKSVPGVLKNTANSVKTFIRETRDIAELNIDLKDQIFNYNLVKHAQDVKLGKKQLMTDEKSNLKSGIVKSKEGYPLEEYDHYDKYTNTADIDLKTPYQYATSENGALHMHKVSNVTVFLDENGQPDFSNPQNSSVLSHRAVLNQILEKDPKCIETIPASYIVGLSKEARQDLATAYGNGIEERRASGDWGYNEFGEAMTEQEFLDEANDRFSQKKDQAKKLEAARQGAQNYDFEK